MEDKEELIKEVFKIRKMKKKQYSELKKLHRVYGHPSADRLCDLLKGAGEFDHSVEKKLEKIFSNCRICRKYRKKSKRPTVSLPKANDLNECVSVDLKPVASITGNANDKRQIVYMVDEASRYTKGGISKSKEAEDVVEVLINKWCLGFMGYPKKCFKADHGTEFNNKTLGSLGRKLNVRIKLGPAYSPWSNGLCERRHAMIDETIKKLLEDEKNLKLEDALRIACYVRNQEQTTLGFSPHQVVYAAGSVLPGITDGTLATDEKVTDSEVVRRHFERMKTARETMIKADHSDRIKIALKQKQIPGYMDTFYERGSSVLFLDKDDKWSGPAEIEAVDGATLVLKYNGNIKHVHKCKAQLVDKDELLAFDDQNETEDESSDESEGETSDSENEDEAAISPDVSVEENIERMQARPTKGSLIKFKTFEDSKWKTGKVKEVGKKDGKNQNHCWIENENGIKVYDFQNDVEIWGYRKVKITFGQNSIRNFNKEEASSKSVKEVLFVSEETDGKTSKDWNMKEKEQDKAGAKELIDANADEKEPIKVLAVELPRKEYNRPEVQEAMREELKKWEKFAAFETVEDIGQEKIDCRWVVTKKEEHDGQKVDFKSRLVIRGFKETEDPRSDSPTAAKETNKIVTAIAANEGWKITSIDVTSAFLQGASLTRDVFVEPPKEVKVEGMIWKLNKGGYGLLDASRLWFLDVRETLVASGCKNVSGDEAFFYYRKAGKLSGLVIVHVDDFYGTGDEDFTKDILDTIYKKYECSKREVDKFRFTGIDVEKTDDGILMSQNEYTKSIEEIEVKSSEDIKRDLNKEEFKQFRKATGKLSWLS